MNRLSLTALPPFLRTAAVAAIAVASCWLSLAFCIHGSQGVFAERALLSPLFSKEETTMQAEEVMAAS